jgi:predicted AAA+ superfamily ATPase
MDVNTINSLLLEGRVDVPGLFPHLDSLAQTPFRFEMHFGLEDLPQEGGTLLIRGPRQYGKSTWLEMELRKSVREFGPGSAIYLNGDALSDRDSLTETLRSLIPMFRSAAPVKRIFIDEITAVKDWQRSLKTLLDAGELRDVLIVSTGSRAADLRHGAERLPGRKGKLGRTNYYFTPVSFREFKRVCQDSLGHRLLAAYIVSGGSPVALAELASVGRLPEYVPEMVRDWIYGEAAAAGRARVSLIAVLETLFLRGGTPLGQAKLARDSGLANNTVAAGYIELLTDLLCLSYGHAWDPQKRVRLMRKPAKFHFINLLAAVAWHPSRIRSPEDFLRMAPEEQGKWLEWMAAQEIWRRSAIAGNEMPEMQTFWQGNGNEVDFVLGEDRFLEVKRGKAQPLEFAWFPRVFPKGDLTVINAGRFESGRIRGITMEDFLLEAP